MDDPKEKNKLKHDAKSHLTVIYGYLHILGDSLASNPENSDKYKKIIQKTIDTCKELEKSIEQLP